MEIDFLKRHFSKLRVIKANLFANVRNEVNFRRQIQEKRLVDYSLNDVIVDQLGKEPHEVVYLPSENLIFVPKSLLVEPYFDSKFPR